MKMDSEEFQAVLRNSLIARCVYSSGGDDRDVIVQMDKVIQSLGQRLMELELIAPRKIVVGGTAYIYRCPDHLVP